MLHIISEAYYKLYMMKGAFSTLEKNVTRTQSANLSELTSELMGTVIRSNNETAYDVCADAGWEHTASALLVAALWMKAYKGDVSAAKLIREITGEAETEASCGDLSRLSEAELWQIVHRETAASDTAKPEKDEPARE